MGRDVTKIRPPVSVARHALAVISDCEKMAAVFATAGNGNRAGFRVDAVLDQLRNRLARLMDEEHLHRCSAAALPFHRRSQLPLRNCHLRGNGPARFALYQDYSSTAASSL